MFEFDRNSQLNFSSDFYNNSFDPNQVCPKCGIKLIEVEKTGIVGCANCYKIFENQIKTMIAKRQGTINHLGKVSSKHFSRIRLKEKLSKLEADKELAIKNENFIVAESLKNQIEKLKGDLQWKIIVLLSFLANLNYLEILLVLIFRLCLTNKKVQKF